jgi:hypothetical protein
MRKGVREECITNCRDILCSKDERTCDQISSMIQEKSDYEWGNLCKSVSPEKCNNYLGSLKDVEFYVNYIRALSDKSQKIYDQYKANATSKNRLSVISTAANSEVGSDEDSI